MLKVSKEDGFSLIELLVVMAILGIVTIPLVNVFAQSIRYLQSSKRKKVAGQVANSCLSKLRSVVEFSKLPDNGLTSCEGATGSSWYTYSRPSSAVTYEYKARSEKVADVSGREVKLIKIKVRYPSRTGGNKRCLSTKDCSKWDISTLVAKR